MTLETIHKIYFIGIGGIGMSALASYFHYRGKEVSGYDRYPSATTQMLSALNISIYHDIDPSHTAGQDLVVYTPAIPTDNAELVSAQKQGIPVMKRAAALGLISKAYQTLAIAGTHGKTTTASMLAHLLYQGGMPSTAFLGGITKNYQSNYLTGTSPYAVIEADEYDRSFLHLNPYMTVVTAMDPDHLECYGTHASMQQTFIDFADQTHSQQPLLVRDSLSSIPWKRAIQTYGIDQGDYYATNISYDQLETSFDFVGDHIRISDIRLALPGKHNISNMVAALSIGHRVGLDAEDMKRAAGSFEGILRRFEVKYHSSELTYIDDYAHHPVEVQAVIQTIKDVFPDRSLHVIFQPHLYSRTLEHYQAFGAVLSGADHVLLMDIYPAREQPIPGVSSELILEQIRHGQAEIVERTELTKTLQNSIQMPTVIMTLGAGDIDLEVEKLSHWIHQTQKIS